MCNGFNGALDTGFTSSIRKFFYCLPQTCKSKTIGQNVNHILLNAISVGDRLLSPPNPSWIPHLTTRQKQAHKYKHSLIGLSADTCPHSGPIPPANPVLSQPAHTPPAGQTSHVPPQPPFGLPVTKRLLHSKTEHVNDGSYHCHSTSDPNHSPLLLLHAVPILTPNSKIGLII